MRIAIPVLLILMAASCRSSSRVSEKEINDPDLAYITHYDSRLSQARMKKIKSRYNRSVFGISWLNASASPAYRFDPAFAESHKELPNYFRKIRLINESGAVLYADLITRDTISADLSLSVKKMVLPDHSFINLLTVRGGNYALSYSRNENMSDSTVMMFKPADNKIIHIRTSD